HCPADRQAEPGPAALRARLVHAVEAAEDARQVFLCDPDTRVRHRDDGPAVLLSTADPDAPARRRVLQRVVDQVVEVAPYVTAAREGRAAGPLIQRQLNPLLLGELAHVADDLLQQRAKFHRAARLRIEARVLAAEEQQLVGQPAQAGCLL